MGTGDKVVKTWVRGGRYPNSVAFLIPIAVLSIFGRWLDVGLTEDMFDYKFCIYN